MSIWKVLSLHCQERSAILLTGKYPNGSFQFQCKKRTWASFRFSYTTTLERGSMRVNASPTSGISNVCSPCSAQWTSNGKNVPWNGAVSMRSCAGLWETWSICITLRHNLGAPADIHVNALGILIIFFQRNVILIWGLKIVSLTSYTILGTFPITIKSSPCL